MLKYVYFINYSGNIGKTQITRTCEFISKKRIKSIQQLIEFCAMAERDHNFNSHSCVVNNWKLLRFKISFRKSS